MKKRYTERKQWDEHSPYLVDMRRVFDEERSHGHCLRRESRKYDMPAP